MADSTHSVVDSGLVAERRRTTEGQNGQKTLMAVLQARATTAAQVCAVCIRKCISRLGCLHAACSGSSMSFFTLP